MGITQSWISRLEAGSGDITAVHLQSIRKEFSITADAFIDGTLSYLAISKKFNFTPKLKKRHSNIPNATIRILTGIVRYFSNHVGQDLVEQMLEDIHIPSELFAEPNFPIHINSLIDIIQYGIDKGWLTNHGKSKEIWQEIAKLTITAEQNQQDPNSMTEASSGSDTFEIKHQPKTNQDTLIEYVKKTAPAYLSSALFSKVTNETNASFAIEAANEKGLFKCSPETAECLSLFASALLLEVANQQFNLQISVSPAALTGDSKEQTTAKSIVIPTKEVRWN